MQLATSHQTLGKGYGTSQQPIGRGHAIGHQQPVTRVIVPFIIPVDAALSYDFLFFLFESLEKHKYLTFSYQLS